MLKLVLRYVKFFLVLLEYTYSAKLFFLKKRKKNSMFGMLLREHRYLDLLNIFTDDIFIFQRIKSGAGLWGVNFLVGCA